MQKIHETLSPGEVVFDRYLVVDVIGTGGFSAVYLVEDQQGVDSFFALKEVIATSQEARKLFTFECNLLKRLEHPSLPRVHQVYENEEHTRLSMLMDYVEGPDLETLRYVQPEKRFSLPIILAILAPVVDAIAYLHQQQPPVIHRDIKPANIIVPITGGKTILVDFGIAKEYDELDTTSAVRHGSPGYGAPEHYATGTNARTDIYGLGATIYTLLTGRVPADALDRMMHLTNGEPDPLKPVGLLIPTIPLHISTAIERAMSIKMSQRFATVEEFWQAMGGETAQPPHITEALNSLVASPHAPQTASSRATTAPQRQQEKTIPGRRPHRRTLLAIFLVLVLIVGLGAGFWRFAVVTKGRVVAPTAGLSTNPTSLPTFTPIAHSKITPTVTAPANQYPRLLSSYHGTLYNLVANVPYQLTLTNMRQNGGNISGFLNATQLSGAYTGFIDTSKHIYFTMAAGKAASPTSFWGSVGANGHLDGSFCQIGPDGQCIPGGVFGVWSADPGIASFIPTHQALLTS